MKSPARGVRRTARAVVTGTVALATAVLATLALTGSASGSDEGSGLAEPRGPLVREPVTTDAVERTWSARRMRRGMNIVADCGTPVVAAHPGVARVDTRDAWGPRVRIAIVSSPGELVTVQRFLRRPTVTDGQLIQAGQQIGEVAWAPRARTCKMNFRVRAGGKAQEAPSWLAEHVGRTTPTTALLGDPGFTIASFNILGASHTAKGGSRSSWPDYDVRMPQMIDYLERYGADVVGMQEFQEKQVRLFKDTVRNQWAMWPRMKAKADRANAIVWRKSRFRLLEGATFSVPYFNGNIRQMPYVLLQDKATGRTAYVANVHNPASVKRYGDQSRWRAEAIRRERQLVIDLRASGRPVFLTGDFNDRAEAFCPLTKDKLMISPDSVPAYDCAMPPYYWVDWIFAAGQTRFTWLTVDTSTKDNKVTDHPLVVARAHLQD